MKIDLQTKLIHMNRQKETAVSRITLDEDFIVPDTMEDVEQIVMSRGEVLIETVRPQGEKLLVRGRLMFYVLYGKDSGGLCALGGELPFDEVIPAAGLEETDEIQLVPALEDLRVEMINSRKLSINAVVSLEARMERLQTSEAAVEAECEDAALQVQKKKMEAVTIAARRKDTLRIREDLLLPGSRPNIDHLLWNEIRLRSVTVRPENGKVRVGGELAVFLIYAAEGDRMPVQWVEESIPFSGEVEIAASSEELIPAVGVRILHRGVDLKPDADGEMREFAIDAVLEAEIKLYREETIEIISDLYSTGCEVTAETGIISYDRLLARNQCRARVGETLRMKTLERILQICHSSGTVKVDEAVPEEDGLRLEGVLELNLLYLTDDDAEPVRAAAELLPFRITIEAAGIQENSVWQLQTGLEQLTAVMTGSDALEVKAVLAADLLVFQPEEETVVKEVHAAPQDPAQLQELPGIVGYLVQPGDTLWKIAKKFHTTVDNIKETNSLTGEETEPGQKLILIKEVR